jgi:hypothetical protein
LFQITIGNVGLESFDLQEMFKGRHKSSYKELKKGREEYDDEDNLYGGKRGLK